MNLSTKAIRKQVWVDLLIFFREPFFALPILFLPGLFFVVYAGAMAKSAASMEGFGQYIPIYMVLVVFLTVFFNIGMQYVTDKQSGIFKRLLLSPIRLSNLVLTYAIKGMLISVLGFIEMTAIAALVFRIPLSEHMPAVFLAFVIIAAVMMLISLSLHGFFKNTRQQMPVAIIGFQYVLFASGMILPVEQMPKILQYLVYINPVYHMNLVLLRVWFGRPQNWVNLLALAAWVALSLVFLWIQKRRPMDRS